MAITKYHTEDHITAGAFRAVTPSDTVDLPDGPAFIYVGVGGDVECIGAGQGETAVVFKNVPAGALVGNAARIRRVKAGSTTATNLIAIY